MAIEGFTRLPNAVVTRKAFLPGPRATLDLLLHFARQDGRCFPEEETLAEFLGAGVRSVRRYLIELEQLGLIRIERRPGKPSIYLLDPGHFGRAGPPTPASFARTPASFAPTSGQNSLRPRPKVHPDEDPKTKTQHKDTGLRRMEAIQEVGKGNGQVVLPEKESAATKFARIREYQRQRGAK